MKDRVPLYPGRVKLAPVSGQENTYDMVRADEPTQEGTPLNKANLLSDETAALYGLGEEGTVNDALFGASGKIDTVESRLALSVFGYRVLKIKVTSKDGTPVEGIKINGIKTTLGTYAITGADGIAIGQAIGDETTVTISYFDLERQEVYATPNGEITTSEIVIADSDFKNFAKIETSKSVTFSPLLKRIDVTVVGGGGAGGGYNDSTRGKPNGGGGGGYCKVQENVSFLPNKEYNAVIGAGGKSADSAIGAPAPGGDGGTTSFLGVTAEGGKGGTESSGGAGNGKGGNPGGGNGVAGSVDGYKSFTETQKYGGGGGGGAQGGSSGTKIGGNPATADGGKGGNATSNTGYPGDNAKNGTGAGGGGGGGTLYNAYSRGSGGDGGSGLVACRMYH